ncbi:LysM peptidoglycan-binding domain-containing protein [Anaerocolumna jejuensis]|uniref:LysM peptidoglycan-binding domain-containing protein n=1 Tax=Anaerocolumna jejuensis TaxID=259063 RepID=UPI003F7BC60B
MYIHIVQPGDTITTIADSYGVSPERIAAENDISNPYKLAIGEALVILQPDKTYNVQKGDTLESIAKSQGTDVMELLRNNPNTSNRELYTGEELVISYADKRTAAVRTNGFAYSFIDRRTLEKTLPYLTYLTIYSYRITENGGLTEVDDSEIIQMARAYRVAPIMFITASNEGSSVNTDIAHTLISNTEIQTAFTNNILDNLHRKGYYGINIDTPFVQPQDRQAYVKFIAKITERLNSEGFFVTVTIAPSTFEVSTGIIYEGIDYTGLSQAANNVLYQLTYVWRYPHSLPISILPFDAIIQTLDKALMLISPEKFVLGFSNVGYLWEFPFFSAIINVNFINYNSAIELANDTGSSILFNEPSRSSYFKFIDSGLEYMAWLKDIRALYPMLEYAQSNELQGISLWNIMYFITNTWLVVNALYVIEKI